MRPLKDRSAFFLLGVLSSLLILSAYWYRPGFLSVLDLNATDAMFAARGESPAPEEVVIVAIDEKSVNEHGRWPWHREKTARLIEALKPSRVTALDIVFSEEENLSSDKSLSSAIKDSRNTVLGYFFRNDSTQEPKPASLAQLNSSKISFLNFLSENAAPDFPGPEFSSIEANIPIVGQGASGFGAFNTVPEPDGIYRQAHLVFKWGPDIYPSLPLEALRKYLSGDIVLNMALYGIDSVDVAGKKVPLDEQGAFSLNFYGTAGSFKTYSASDVMNGKIPEEAIKDKLVFVGVTEKAVYDIRPTPMDPLFPGVEI
ncbi:MAG: CHASE2 domain-containing protein, partial [Deltaproteobacteria bacterium]|nr:CHASE2 domain-containing protein [Deltaproteobacteria bacterium]